MVPQYILLWWRLKPGSARGCNICVIKRRVSSRAHGHLVFQKVYQSDSFWKFVLGLLVPRRSRRNWSKVLGFFLTGLSTLCYCSAARALIRMLRANVVLDSMYNAKLCDFGTPQPELQTASTSLDKNFSILLSALIC